MDDRLDVLVASAAHVGFADAICDLMAEAAKVRGTGIAKRDPVYVARKMEQGKAVIALAAADAQGATQRLAGFCYIERWEGRKFVANSGLIVHPDFRGRGLARRIKAATFDLSRRRYPQAKLFGITTSPAVMHVNSELGYRPVPLYELTQDETFWRGCASCPNYDILMRNDRQMCLCTAMLAPSKNEEAARGR